MNLVFDSYLVERGLTVPFNSSISMKSNKTFIYSKILMNGLYFLTPLSYVSMSLNILMMSNFPNPRKRRFQMKSIYGTCDWVILILTKFTIWLKV